MSKFKILLDENLPLRLKTLIDTGSVHTIRDMKWIGKTNGELLKLLLKGNFTHFITADKNLRHQQNLKNYPLGLVLLDVPNLRYQTIAPVLTKVISKLSRLPSGLTIVS